MALLWGRPSWAGDGGARIGSRLRPENVAEGFVERWAAGDARGIARLASPEVAHRVLTEGRFRWRPTTPATNGPRLHLDASEEKRQRQVQLSGTMTWGAARRRMVLVLAQDARGYRVVEIKWRDTDK